MNQSLSEKMQLIQNSLQRGKPTVFRPNGEKSGWLIRLRFLFIFTFTLFSFHNYAQIVISEILASNKNSIKDQFGESSDWIELYNNSTTTINLLNWSLTDDSGQRSKWRFPSITLASGEYLIVFTSGRNITDL